MIGFISSQWYGGGHRLSEGPLCLAWWDGSLSLLADIVRHCSSQELSVLQRSRITQLIPSNPALLRNNIWDIFFHCLHWMCSCVSVSCAAALKGVHYSSLIEKAVAWGKRWPSLVLLFWLVSEKKKVAVKKGTLIMESVGFLVLFGVRFSFLLQLKPHSAQIFW